MNLHDRLSSPGRLCMVLALGLSTGCPNTALQTGDLNSPDSSGPDAGIDAGDGGSNVDNDCPAGRSTIVSGKVVTGTVPSGQIVPDPVYNATVYVSSTAPGSIPTGPVCASCVSRSSFPNAVTGVDGNFSINHVPRGDQYLIIELGKWRRVVHLNVNHCATNALSTSDTHLPRTQGGETGFDNIPKMAMVSASNDTMECVLRKMGIADSEFVNPNSDGSTKPTGRIQLYQGGYAISGSPNGRPGATIRGSTTPNESTLWSNQTNLNAYDVVLFPCQGQGHDPRPVAAQGRIASYLDNGGRVFTTHFNYVWLDDPNNPNQSFGSQVASWAEDSGGLNPYGATAFTATVNRTFARGAALGDWLRQTGASGNGSTITVEQVRHDFTSTAAKSDLWMSADTSGAGGVANQPIHMTFDTPLASANDQKCGRAVFSDFHVEDAITNRPQCSTGTGSQGCIFPAECTTSALSPQERLLEYMILDLTSCVSQVIN